MKFNAVFIAAALVISASPALSSVTFEFFDGADCTGNNRLEFTNAPQGECISIAHGDSEKSISYSGVPSGHIVQFFNSGGPNDGCKGSPSLTLGSGSGCGTAPAG